MSKSAEEKPLIVDANKKFMEAISSRWTKINTKVVKHSKEAASRALEEN